MSSRIVVSRDKPEIIRRFSESLKRLVERTASCLKDFFNDSIDGYIGQKHKEIVINLFDEWCCRNDITPLSDLYKFLLDKSNNIII